METDNKSVLVIDDEEIVRLLLGEMLDLFGHHAVCVDCGIDGVEIYEKSPDAFDLVILDLSMPYMDGQQTFEALSKINPEIRVIITTGHSDTKEFGSLLNNDGIRLLHKPFSMGDLSEAIEEAVSN